MILRADMIRDVIADLRIATSFVTILPVGSSKPSGDGTIARATWALPVAGLVVGFGLWFFGFMVVAGEYFLMWQSKAWNGQEAAFRIATEMLGGLIFITLPDGELA